MIWNPRDRPSMRTRDQSARAPGIPGSARASRLWPTGLQLNSAPLGGRRIRMKMHENRDLEAERAEFLERLRALIPDDLRRRIEEAASVVSQSKEVRVMTSQSGAADADFE